MAENEKKNTVASERSNIPDNQATESGAGVVKEDDAVLKGDIQAETSPAENTADAPGDESPDSSVKAEKESQAAGKKEAGTVKKTWKEIAAERREQLKEITERLEAGLKEYMANDVQFKKVLETMAKFHHYSANNVLLIAMQMPTATHVASYGNWQKKFNRQVKKGQKGLSIIAPAPYKKKTEREVTDPATGKPVLDGSGNPQMEEVEITVPRFKVAKVFDLSQTFGDPLPELDVPELEGNAENYEMFMDALRESSPVPIRFDNIPGDAKGYYDNRAKEIVIKEGMSEVQTVKTAVHEVVHARLHDRDRMKDQGVVKSRETKEIEAEACAYTVLFHFKIDTSDYSIPYLGSFSAGQDTKTLRESMDTIRITASQIIDEVSDFISERMKERDIDRFTIYQINEDTPGRDFIFMGMDYVKQRGISISSDYYREVYQAPLKEGDTLDALYARFNQGNYPSDYKGHSMSMSDVVVLHQAGEDHAYYVDSFGFTEVPEFVIDTQDLQTTQDIEKEAREDFQPAPDAPFPEKTADDLPPEHEDQELSSTRPEQPVPQAAENAETEPDPDKENGNDLAHQSRDPFLTFYVAECMDFPVMGEYISGLTLAQAVELYEKLPSSNMQGGKGIGVMVDDGQELSVSCRLVTDGQVREDAFREFEAFRDTPAFQDVIREARDYFPDRLQAPEQSNPVPGREAVPVSGSLAEQGTGARENIPTVHPVKKDPVEKDPVHSDKRETGSRKNSVLAALRKHQKDISERSTGNAERTKTVQKQKGGPEL